MAYIKFFYFKNFSLNLLKKITKKLKKIGFEPMIFKRIINLQFIAINHSATSLTLKINN